MTVTKAEVDQAESQAIYDSGRKYFSETEHDRRVRRLDCALRIAKARATDGDA